MRLREADPAANAGEMPAITSVFFAAAPDFCVAMFASCVRMPIHFRVIRHNKG